MILSNKKKSYSEIKFVHIKTPLMLVIQWLHNVRVLHRGSHLPSFTTDKVQVSESAKKTHLKYVIKINTR